MDVVRLGKILKALRGSLSQQDLERISGVPQGVISNLELGKTEKPGFEHVCKIADACGVSPTEIAAAVDLVPIPTAQWDEEHFMPELVRQLRAIRSLGLSLKPEQQVAFANRLSSVVEIQRQSVAHNSLEESESDIIPTWLRKTVRG